MAGRALGQIGRVLVLDASSHGVAGENVLRDSVLEKVAGHDILRPAGLDVLFVHRAPHAAEFVARLRMPGHR